MEPEKQKKYFPIFNFRQKVSSTSHSRESQNSSELFSVLNPLAIQKEDEEMNIEEKNKKKVTIVKKATDSLDFQKKTPSTSTTPKRTNYNEHADENEKMKEAIACYKNKSTVKRLPNGEKITTRSVSKYYDVKRATFQDRLSGRYSVNSPPKLGRKATFTNQELTQVVDHLLKMAQIGYGYTPLQTINLLQFLAKEGVNIQTSRLLEVLWRTYLGNFLKLR